MKKRKTPDLEKYLEGKKHRFVNYTQGAKIYKMSYWPFVRLAKKSRSQLSDSKDSYCGSEYSG